MKKVKLDILLLTYKRESKLLFETFFMGDRVHIHEAISVDSAKDLLKTTVCQLILIDNKSGKFDIDQIVTEIRSMEPQYPVMIMSSPFKRQPNNSQVQGIFPTPLDVDEIDTFRQSIYEFFGIDPNDIRLPNHLDTYGGEEDDISKV